MDANARQVGGDHYKAEYQHWDFVVDTDMCYLLGCATKYISRWRKKNGVQDLEKALHYIEKYHQTSSSTTICRNQIGSLGSLAITKFFAVNKIPSFEQSVIRQLLEAHSKGDIVKVIQFLQGFICAQKEQVLPVAKNGVPYCKDPMYPMEAHPFPFGYSKEEDSNAQKEQVLPVAKNGVPYCKDPMYPMEAHPFPFGYSKEEDSNA